MERLQTLVRDVYEVHDFHFPKERAAKQVGVGRAPGIRHLRHLSIHVGRTSWPNKACGPNIRLLPLHAWSSFPLPRGRSA